MNNAMGNVGTTVETGNKTSTPAVSPMNGRCRVSCWVTTGSTEGA